RAMNETQSLQELVTQSERLGVPAGSARTHLDGARKAIEDGNVDGFERGLTDARASLEESRKSHFLEKYETRVHAVSTMMANAKRLGAELGDAAGSLEQAEAALRAGDIAMADIGVGEVVPVRVGVRPKGTGSVPVAVGITYKRMFDENRYEVRDTKEIKVEPESTYLVEDVFLIHSDGRLIAHHSRKFREEI